jgi:hypothetical protein
LQFLSRTGCGGWMKRRDFIGACFLFSAIFAPTTAAAAPSSILCNVIHAHLSGRSQEETLAKNISAKVVAAVAELKPRDLQSAEELSGEKSLRDIEFELSPLLRGKGKKILGEIFERAFEQIGCESAQCRAKYLQSIFHGEKPSRRLAQALYLSYLEKLPKAANPSDPINLPFMKALGFDVRSAKDFLLFHEKVTAESFSAYLDHILHGTKASPGTVNDVGRLAHAMGVKLGDPLLDQVTAHTEAMKGFDKNSAALFKEGLVAQAIKAYMADRNIKSNKAMGEALELVVSSETAFDAFLVEIVSRIITHVASHANAHTPKMAALEKQNFEPLALAIAHELIANRQMMLAQVKKASPLPRNREALEDQSTLRHELTAAGLIVPITTAAAAFSLPYLDLNQHILVLPAALAGLTSVYMAITPYLTYKRMRSKPDPDFLFLENRDTKNFRNSDFSLRAIANKGGDPYEKPSLMPSTEEMVPRGRNDEILEALLDGAKQTEAAERSASPATAEKTRE